MYFVPAFVGLGAPVLGRLRTRDGRRVDVRAQPPAIWPAPVCEFIAYQSSDVLDVMARESGREIAALRVDGGAARNDLLMQFQADLLGKPVQRPSVTETTALGAAYLAGLATGFWTSPDQVSAGWQLEREYLPRMSADLRGTLLDSWHRAVERSRGWAAPV